MAICDFFEDIFQNEKIEVVTKNGLSKYIGPKILDDVVFFKESIECTKPIFNASFIHPNFETKYFLLQVSTIKNKFYRHKRSITNLDGMQPGFKPKPGKHLI